MRELKICHPNAKGTGSCLRVTYTKYGYMEFSIYPQGRMGDMSAFNFGWNDGVSVLADWRSLAEILMVFRGECESLRDGNGILCVRAEGWSKLMLRNVIEPVHCYVLEIDEVDNDSRSTFQLSLPEALGLSLIIEGVLHHTLIGGEP